MSYISLRIHPAIGIARVGNSEEYYIGPETMAGMDISGQVLTGGLPIRPGTDGDTITSAEVRDSSGKLKRQAARFRIYQYTFADKDGLESYPVGQGEEIKIGSLVDGKTIKDIIWTVHLANKKANSWDAGDGLAPFQNNHTPDIRNPDFGKNPADASRLKKLVIDAGPRALSVLAANVVHFDKTTPASASNALNGSIESFPDYPTNFPASDTQTNPQLHSRAITTLGAMSTETNGRLIVLGGYGLACGFDRDGNYSTSVPLEGNVNNDYWLDDTADGPVTALLIFDDGSSRAVDGSAWVISADPSYAPQITNVVTLWDDLYCTWLENCGLQPDIYSKQYQASYSVNFAKEVYPIFRAASLQKWNTFLPSRAIAKHDQIGNITADWSEFRIMNFIRDPNQDDEARQGSPLMPLSLGDAGKSFLSPTRAQYFFLQQWATGKYRKESDTAEKQLGAGEQLDKTVLFNCLGGRFSPGIEMSFIVRDANLYQCNWQHHSNGGPFRIRTKKLDYSVATKNNAFLTVGYIPLRGDAVEPGDLSKFMALPWHTDYNSCATHTPDPNPGSRYPRDKTVLKQEMETLKANWEKGMPDFNTLLYSSWPAQRPVAVYAYDDVVANDYQLSTPRYSVRGEGTVVPGNIIEPAQLTAPDSWEFSLSAEQVGRYQQREGILLNWHKIGVVMQAPAIVGAADNVEHTFYLEVASGFDTDESNLAEPWPNTVIDKTYAPIK